MGKGKIMQKLRNKTVNENRSIDLDRAWKMLGETPMEHRERLEREKWMISQLKRYCEMKKIEKEFMKLRPIG